MSTLANTIQTEKRPMFQNMSEVKVQDGDRVAVVIDGKIVKARVTAVDMGLVFVTTAKDAPALTFNPADVFPLYRPSNGLVFCSVPQFAKPAE
jgi:hypothetical protein